MGKHVNRRELANHEVGYCRPPRRKKGDTRKRPILAPGRGVGTRQMMTDFFEALEEVITVTQNGRKVRLPASKVVFRQLTARAAKGESWAIRRLTDLQLKLLELYERGLEHSAEFLGKLRIAQADRTEPLSEEEKIIWNELQRRVSNAGRELFDSDEPAQPIHRQRRARRYGPI